MWPDGWVPPMPADLGLGREIYFPIQCFSNLDIRTSQQQGGSDPEGPGEGLGVCISNKFSGDVIAAGPRTTSPWCL